MPWMRRLSANHTNALLAGPGDADVRQPPLFLQARLAALVDRADGRKQPLLPAGQEHDVELQPLGGVERHQGDGLAAGLALRVRHQRDVLQEGGQRIELLHGADQLLEVLQPARRIGRAVGLQHVGVAGFLEDDLGKLGVGEGAELRAPARRTRR